MLVNLLVIILFIGIVLMLVQINYVKEPMQETNMNNMNKQEEKCVVKREIKYIPLTYEQQDMMPVYVSDIFTDMFLYPTPWLNNVQNYDRRKQDAVNQYFISQV